MTQEEKIKQAIINKFGCPEANIKIPRLRRISLEVEYKNFPAVFDYVVKELDFNHLCAITGLDEQDNLGIIYHLAQDGGVLFNLKTSVSKQTPRIETITAYFSSADAYERELVDLLGVEVGGLAPGSRYPLTDDWPKDQFPLRKDWKGVDKDA